MVTHTHGDDIVRTHDEARALLNASANGLRVKIERTRDESGAQRARRYHLFHPSHPETLTPGDTYALPFVASTVSERVQRLASEAARRIRTELLRT
jgi:hypothetical protein